MKYVFRRPLHRAAAGALDFAGGALMAPWKNRAAAPLPPRNLLLIRLDHLGDVWNITGLPKAVKQHFPDCRVTCLVSSAAAALLENNPFIDEVLRFDAPWFWKKKSGPVRRLTAELRGRGFDAALSLRGDLREHWLVFRAGIPRRIGPGITGGGFLLTDCIGWDEDRHEFERIASVAAVIGLPEKIWRPEIHFASGERERLAAETGLKLTGLHGPLVAFQAEAGSEAKTWPVFHASRFLTRLLTARFEGSVVLIGSNRQRGDEIINRLEPPLRARVRNLCAQMTLRELAAAAGKFVLVTAPDSGPGHMLAWLGTPALFLYSGTNRFASWKPLAENAVVLRREVPCSPCGLRVCPVAGHPCMEGIQPETVARAALERLP